uniref:Myb-like domain-containing protein n=1 Tax=Oryza glaberrima TaxID=4538 RepID=I1QMU7_ORYGL
MGPHPPSSYSDKKTCQNVPPEKPSSTSFCHPQFPQHLLSHPAYAMNFPFPPFPHYPPYSQNFQYAVPPQYAPYSLPPPDGAMPSPYVPATVMPSKAPSDQGTPHSVTGPGQQDDDDAEPERTARRLAWTEEEDIRLISTWLINYKTDKYWDKVAAEYNSATPGARRREVKHLKNRWQRMINKVAHFNDCWCRVMAKYPSGQSEGMQQMDKTWLMYNKEAHVMYLEEAKHKFTFGHCWNAVWDQPKWKEYISSFSTKRVMRSESGGYVSSSEDSEDMQEGKCLVDPLDMLPKNHEDMTEVQPSVSNQKKQLELLTTDASWPIEFQLGRHQLMTGTSKLNEHQQGVAVRDEMLEKESGPQDFEVLDNERVAREDEPKKETQPHQGFKARKVNRKRKGKASSSSCEVQEDIKHALYLQTMLNNDREKMSEVQLRLSKEQLELARIKQDEANVKKETTLYMKYTELLLADTSRFDEFQKAEYEKALKHIGGILFSKDVN